MLYSILNIRYYCIILINNSIRFVKKINKRRNLDIRSSSIIDVGIKKEFGRL